MTSYNVHLYREMKLLFPGIEAESHEAAAEFVRQQPTDKAHKIEDCDGNDHGALVDVEGDEDHSFSRLIDFPPITALEKITVAADQIIAAVQGLSRQFDFREILTSAIANEEGNWDGPDDEPEWMKEARAVLAEAAGCCFDDDVRQRPELLRAIEYLARETSRAVYVNRFRKALDEPNPVMRFRAANDACKALARRIGLP